MNYLPIKNNNQGYFILQKFLNSSPEKYYNKESCERYSDFLETNLANNNVSLFNFIIEKEGAFEIAYKTLQNINNKNIHEYEIKDNNVVFIADYANYTYLQLLEGVLLPYLQPIAYAKLISSNKGTDNLDLFNCIENLNNSDFAYVKNIYDHNVRNGIGHGKIIYYESKADYIDKKGNIGTLYYFQLVKKLDLLIDILNGFTLAYIRFLIKNGKSINASIHNQVLFDELRLSNVSENWNILSIIKQDILKSKQLVININSNCHSQDELQNKAIDTAIKTAELIEDRFDIINLNITHNHFPGYVKFDSKKIKLLKSRNALKQEYLSTITDSLNWFLIGFSEEMPKNIDPNAFENNYNEDNKKLKTSSNEIIGDFLYRDIYQYASSDNSYILIKDIRYVYIGMQTDKNNIIKSIKNNLSKISEHAREKSKKLTMSHKHKELPIKYLTIAIFDSDRRVRNLRRNGIEPNLICTILYNTTSQVGNIKLMESKTETFQNAFFNWNHFWRNIDAYKTMFPD